MRPNFEIISTDTIKSIIAEAIQLLDTPGIKVQSQKARGLLSEAGAYIKENDEIVHIPEYIANNSIKSAPTSFSLYDRVGLECVIYGDDYVHFDPGSSAVHILDPETYTHNPSKSQDLINIIKIVEMLSQYDAQSTASICNDIPKEIGDLYRLYLVLLYSKKPVVTGAFSKDTAISMFEMLSIIAGGKDNLRQKPIAIFDVCPTPPLTWSNFAAENLIDLAEASIPAQIVSMPLSGATAPVTLLGSLVQHTAETISGICIHQTANPGAPIVWGGAPAIFDMRYGTTPMGAVETAMMDAAYAQIGKYIGLPTHTYLGSSDSKIVDAQAGLESGIGTLIGALAGINMISGGGMLDFLACQSPEKIIIDAEAISMAKRMISGISQHSQTLGIEFFEGTNFKGEFLKQNATRLLFKKEQYIPSKMIDRSSLRDWQHGEKLDIFARARNQAYQLVQEYERPQFPLGQITELQTFVKKIVNDVGLENLPHQ